MFVARRLVEVFVAAVMVVGLLLASDRGEDKAPEPSAKGVLRDGFEERQPIWLREYSDASVNLIAHERSERAAHGGRLSERFQFEAGGGSRFFVELRHAPHSRHRRSDGGSIRTIEPGWNPTVPARCASGGR